MFAAGSASAQVATGSQVKLGDGFGSGPGGEFNASVVGGSGLGETFLTFCLERNEYFNSYNQTLYVQNVNTAAVLGGISTANSIYNDPSPVSSYTFVGNAAPTASSDPLSYGTAYLYTQFRAGTLSSYDYGTGAARVADANSLQNAVWFLEGELTQAAIAGDAQALAWVEEARDANWTNLGNVRVLNLWQDAAYTIKSQDQLYLISPVPEPETYAMLLAGLGLMGFVARRRRSANRAA